MRTVDMDQVSMLNTVHVTVCFVKFGSIEWSDVLSLAMWSAQTLGRCRYIGVVFNVSREAIGSIEPSLP